MIKQENYSIVCDIFMQIFECVKYFAFKKYSDINRDLKLDNIILFNCGNNELTVILNEFCISIYPEYNINQI
jgi:hypothetical protein